MSTCSHSSSPPTSPLQNAHVDGLFPGFVLNVVLNGNKIEFEPEARGFNIVVLNALDKAVDAVMIIPPVETKLYPSESAHASKPNLKPIIDPKTVESAKYEVSVTIMCPECS